MRGPGGYGRYNDDPEHVGCPRAKTDMTPCVARDGQVAVADDSVCVGCGIPPGDLLRDLVREVTAPEALDRMVPEEDLTIKEVENERLRIELVRLREALERIADRDEKWGDVDPDDGLATRSVRVFARDTLGLVDWAGRSDG